MGNCRTGLPPLKSVDAALRRTTETLASELAQPTASAPNWSDFEWHVAMAVAAIHGVSSLLAARLPWRGPPAWTRFLQSQQAHTTTRHQRIAQLIGVIGEQARREDIPAMALKGAELHAMGLYAAGERPMADIDLLVRESDLERASQMLERVGYQRSYANWKHTVFAPRISSHAHGLGEHPDNPIKVELHHRVHEISPVHLGDVSHRVFPRVLHAGLNSYPSKASLMSHLLLHAAGAMVVRALRLLNLHDLALLSSHMSEEDWNEVLAQDGRRHWWAWPPLQLTARYYPQAIPLGAQTALASACPFLLTHIARRRTLYDVSLSQPWVQALPGIAWSHSLPEMVRYSLKRFRPDKATLTVLEALARNEAWASRSDWSRLSHGGRVLRWVTSRPTRPPTMHAIYEALALE